MVNVWQLTVFRGKEGAGKWESDALKIINYVTAADCNVPQMCVTVLCCTMKTF